MSKNGQKISIPAIILILLSLSASIINAEDKRTLVLENFDRLNRRETDSGSVWYGYGNIRLRLDSTSISSDSLVWYRDRNIIHFFGRVEAYDSAQHIWAEQLSYYGRDSVMVARKNVTLIHTVDSVKTESQLAEYDRVGQVVYLDGEPRLFLNYPDSANMVEVVGDYLTFYAEDKTAEAEDNVVINYQNTRATCGCAEYIRKDDQLILRDDPLAVRDSSTISGKLMKIFLSGSGVRQIDVYEEANAYFVEEADSSTGEFSGDSKLSGENITFYFNDDEIRKIAASGAARSEYYPSPDDTTGSGKNFVSGDTIFIYVDNRRITKAEIKGGAEGLYITEGQAVDSVQTDSIALTDSSPPDSALIDTVMAEAVDSLASDSTGFLASDSTMTGDSLAASVAPEDTILYRGGYLEYFAANRLIRITGDASVRQGQVSLDADQVDYDIPNKVVLARIVTDSMDTNTAPRSLVLKDGGEEIMGTRLVFNVDTKKGKIEDATTKYENAYYRGQDLYKEDEKVFFVDNGRLTSCDLEEPHFHFRTSQMKLIHNDRAIAKPVTLYIETLPVLRIPYYIFPLKRGRHSGILPIRLGNFEQGSRYIGNLGYYWAASEYWDLQTSLDFSENIGITLNNIFRYNKRYSYNGSVNASYSRDRREYAFSEYKSNRWQIRGSHSQTLPYDIDFRAEGKFVSDKYYSTDFSNDPSERRDRIIISKANFNKRFGGSSLSLSFSHTNNLDDGSKHGTIPSGSFSMPKFQPFGSAREVDGETVSRWYNEIYVGYNNSFGFSTNRRKLTDTVFVNDSTPVVYESRTWKDYGYLDHKVTLSGASQKVLKYINVGPSMNFQETWYYILKSDQAHAAGIPADRPYRRAAVSAGLSSNTNLYGTFPINLMGLMALRHVMSPRVTFGWSPAITKNDPVRKYASLGGGGGAQKSLSFNLDNEFQAKIKKGEEEKKLELLRISSGLSYNFEAKGQKFSNLSTRISSTLMNNVKVSGSLTHDMYDKNDKLIWRSPSLRSFDISASFQARGSVSDDYIRQGLGSDYAKDSLGMYQGTGLDADLSSPGGQGSGGKSDWNLNLSYYYSESKLFGVTSSRVHWIQYTFNMGLTSKWQLKYSHKYDFIRHESIDKVIDLYRKMHCWEAHFYWIPDGSRQGYYFKINVMAIPDIKIEKSESGLRGALFNR